MAPIRVCLVGLSAKGSWAAYAHLPYLRSSEKYDVVALLNSSLESAKASVDAYDLPPSTRTYADVNSMVEDSTVDLVVVCTRLDKHKDTLVSAINAGKDVFVEWPVAVTTEETQKIATLAKAKSVTTMVGLQGRASPMIGTVQHCLSSGKIGRVLSTRISGVDVQFGDVMSEAYEYLNLQDSGGNLHTLMCAHVLDCLELTLGPISKMSTVLATIHPEVSLTISGSSQVSRRIKRTSPDLVSYHGLLLDTTPFQFSVRGGTPYIGEKCFTWNIYGEEGQIQVVADNLMIQMASEIEVRIQKHGQAIEQVRVATGSVDGRDFGLGCNTTRLYENFANGAEFPTFDDAVVRQRTGQKALLSSFYLR